MIGNNKPLSHLNLSNNKLRDEFALALIINIKQNKRISSLSLSENIIDLKHVRTIEKLLLSNKGLARKSVLPVYQRQLDRLQISPGEYNATQRKILEVENECRTEKAVMRQNAEALKKTQAKQLMISAKVKDRKKKVDEELEAAEKRLVDAEEEVKNQEKEHEKGIAIMDKKIIEVNRVIEKLMSESNILGKIKQ